MIKPDYGPLGPNATRLERMALAVGFWAVMSIRLTAISLAGGYILWVLTGANR